MVLRHTLVLKCDVDISKCSISWNTALGINAHPEDAK